jgi:hypothetical protein
MIMSWWTSAARFEAGRGAADSVRGTVFGRLRKDEVHRHLAAGKPVMMSHVCLLYTCFICGAYTCSSKPVMQCFQVCIALAERLLLNFFPSLYMIFTLFISSFWIFDSGHFSRCYNLCHIVFCSVGFNRIDLEGELVMEFRWTETQL